MMREQPVNLTQWLIIRLLMLVNRQIVGHKLRNVHFYTVAIWKYSIIMRSTAGYRCRLPAPQCKYPSVNPWA